ncbi:hypothetical protein PUN28_015119 [Cardiocondyla obscurior]|uniref:Uncharacterized protein n=1 Tax=Cardiocondyla obscurior TaxID=286306 RepID=A0AAW2F1L3_9HYME
MRKIWQNKNKNKDNYKHFLKTLKRPECSNDLRERNDLKKYNKIKLCLGQHSIFVLSLFLLLCTHQFMLSFLHLFFRAHHFLYLNKSLLMSGDFLFIAQSLFGFVYSFL